MRSGAGGPICPRMGSQSDKDVARRARCARHVRGAMDMSMAAKIVRKPKTVLDLEPHDCRWPIGEPRSPDFHFCGERQLEGRPYCALHWGMAFQPARPRHHGQRPQAQHLVIAPPPAAKAA